MVLDRVAGSCMRVLVIERGAGSAPREIERGRERDKARDTESVVIKKQSDLEIQSPARLRGSIRAPRPSGPGKHHTWYVVCVMFEDHAYLSNSTRHVSDIVVYTYEAVWFASLAQAIFRTTSHIHASSPGPPGPHPKAPPRRQKTTNTTNKQTHN